MPLNTSFGVFPSRSSVRSRSETDLQKLYFRTTVGHHHDGREQPPDSRIENLEAIHKMGRKNTKYMKYQINQAPALNRNSCKYNRDYAPKPLGGHICNNDLAALFKGPSTRAELNVDFGNKTKYSETFNNPRTADELKFAKLPLQGPGKDERTQTIGGCGESMVFTSHLQSEHNAPSSGLSKAESHKGKPNIMLGGTVTSDAYRTSYGSEFKTPAKSSQTLDAFFAELKSMKAADSHDVQMFGFRRACYLSPGQ
jgi:hypothetical protein